MRVDGVKFLLELLNILGHYSLFIFSTICSESVKRANKQSFYTFAENRKNTVTARFPFYLSFPFYAIGQLRFPHTSEKPDFAHREQKTNSDVRGEEREIFEKFLFGLL